LHAARGHESALDPFEPSSRSQLDIGQERHFSVPLIPRQDGSVEARLLEYPEG
jgi:hypothetical protein